MNKPSYFNEVQARARARWDQLESDPDLAAPWYQLFKQVQSPRHVLSELLQNADDAGATEARVKIEGGVFAFQHDGEDFTKEQFESLCRFGYSNKRALHTIGFRGIGFKSTFSLGDVVELSTPTLSIAYRRQRFTEPMWLDDGAPDSQTRIRVRLSGPNKQRELEQNFAEWSKSPFSLLFFKNIRSIQIGAEKLSWRRVGPGPVRGSEWMALGADSKSTYLLIRSDPEPFPEEALIEINEERLLRPEEEGAFPPCRVEIVVGAEGRLHVVLPTGVGTALPFAANAPFIQDPARLKIKFPDVSATNRWLLERIGRLSARVMVEWLQRDDLNVADRAGAYSVLPDVDREATSLEGRCAAIVELACDDAIGDSPFLLTEGGQLARPGTVVAVPAPLLEVWPGDQVGTLLDTNSRSPLSSYVPQEHQEKLERWNAIDVLSRPDVVSRMKASHLPKPRTWRQLLTLWGYLAPELGGYQYYTTKKSINLLPVQGRDVLHAANEVVRLGERRMLQSDADWALLADHMLVLNQKWARFLADRRRSVGDDEAEGAEVHASLGLLASLDMEQSSDVSEVIERVAATFFAQPKVPVSKAVQLTQVAAKLGATVGKSFRFVTQDRQLRSIEQGLLFDDGRLCGSLLSEKWCDKHCLDEAYGTFRSCTRDEWLRWIESGRANISAVPLPKRQEKYLLSRSELEMELAGRGVDRPSFYPYVTTSFRVDDWDFDESLWTHWQASAEQDQSLWGRLGDIIWGCQEFRV